VLVNSTDQSESGSIQLFGPGSATESAQPVSVTVYAVPPRSSVRFQTAGSSLAIRVGSLRVTPTGSDKTPSAFTILSLRNAGVTVTEASVQALPAGSAFRMYAEGSGDFSRSAVGSIQTGVAIASTSSVAVPVNLELTTLSGASAGPSGRLTVPAQGQVAVLLNQIQGFESVQLPFRGVLRISTTSPAGIAIVGVRARYNERGDFLITTTPAANEAGTASSGEIMFPHWAVGGGYSTQCILFSGIAGRTSAGMLRFFSQTGRPLI